MIRGLALTASLLLAGTVPALAQTHPGSHSGTYPHGPGHIRPDSGQHDAMHARFHGTWKGTLSSFHGVSSGLDLSVAHDSLLKVILKMSAEQPIKAGVASNFAMNGGQLQWTQDLDGAPCKATAVVRAATPRVPEMMEGKMGCKRGEMAFTLHKETE